MAHSLHLKFGLGLLMLAAAPTVSQAEPAVYAYPTSANYCPAGLQPVTINGAICCGVPNQPITYAQVMQHPVTHRKVRRVYREYIPTEKGIPTGKGLGD